MYILGLFVTFLAYIGIALLELVFIAQMGLYVYFGATQPDAMGWWIGFGCALFFCLLFNMLLFCYW